MFYQDLVFEDGGLWAHFAWEYLPFKHGFSTVLAGNMSMKFGERRKVTDNRERFFRLLDHPQEKTIFINPQHQDKILFLEKYPTIFYPECDGVITTVPGIGIALLPADCLPVILWGRIREQDFIGLIHAGRKGTKLKIIEKAIELLVQKGGKTEEINVAIGPAIHSCCYKLLGMIKIDLIKENIQQALNKEVSIANIIVAHTCTCCAKRSDGTPIFFSHRRAKEQKEKEGRFVAFVGLEKRAL